MPIRSTFFVAAAGAIVAVPSFAAGSVITYGMLTEGETAVTLDLPEATVEATAQGGTFQFKSQGGYDAVGISGGSSPGEIEGDQSITFTFDTPTVITSLSVAFLYPMNDYWGDNWNEVALFTTDLGAFTLEALSDTTSSWSGSGMAKNVSPAFEKEGAVWTITGDDIFGGAITSLVLSSGNPGDDGGYGDFSFHSMVIPTPGTLALLAGALVIGRTRRRPCRH